MADPIDFTERDRDPANWTREKELAYWNRPYVFRPYPKMLYRGTTTRDGRLTVDQRIVGSDEEERQALEIGWVPNPQAATEAETARQEAVGTAAAERAWSDRRLSAAAQAETAALDQTTAKHLGEIPEKAKRPRPTSPERDR